MSTTILKVGVIGANGRTDRWGVLAHIPALQSIPDVELIAVCTAHEETAKRAADRANAPMAFSNYEEMLRHPDIDLVTIAVRNSLHHSIAMAVMNAGKHVFCEWPVGLDSVQGKQALACAQSQGVQHALGFQATFSPAIMRMKELILQGFIGQPMFFHAVHFLPNYLSLPSFRRWLLQRDQGGSVHTILCGHVESIIRYCLGDIVEVCGKTATLNTSHILSDTLEEINVDSVDTVAYLARMEDGLSGTIHVSSICHGSGYWRFELFGKSGKLRAESPGFLGLTPIRLYGAQSEQPDQELSIPQRLRWARLPEKSPSYNVAQMMGAFVHSIREGTEFHPNFEDAVRLHMIQAAVESSSQKHQWVSVG